MALCNVLDINLSLLPEKTDLSLTCAMRPAVSRRQSAHMIMTIPVQANTGTALHAVLMLLLLTAAVSVAY